MHIIVNKERAMYFRVGKRHNINIFLSACKNLKAKTTLKVTSIENISVNEWFELLQTLQSLSKQYFHQLKDTSENFDPFQLKDTSGTVDPFILNGSDVKKMIEVAKLSYKSYSYDTQYHQSKVDYDVYGSPYRDPTQDRTIETYELSVRRTKFILH